MIQPAPRMTDGHEPAPSPVVVMAALEEHDALADWGYEAADPALQARLWGEAVADFGDR